MAPEDQPRPLAVWTVRHDNGWTAGVTENLDGTFSVWATADPGPVSPASIHNDLATAKQAAESVLRQRSGHGNCSIGCFDWHLHYREMPAGWTPEAAATVTGWQLSDEFIRCVETQLDFLRADFGFERAASRRYGASGGCVEFKNGALELSIGCMHGEVDVLITDGTNRLDLYTILDYLGVARKMTGWRVTAGRVCETIRKQATATRTYAVPWLLGNGTAFAAVLEFEHVNSGLYTQGITKKDIRDKAWRNLMAAWHQQDDRTFMRLLEEWPTPWTPAERAAYEYARNRRALRPPD